MDPDIKQLQEEVKRLSVVTQDTNRIVHKLRRNIWWGRVWSILWWVAIFAISAGMYYYYAQPYVDKLMQAYTGFQQKSAQAQSFEQQAQDFLNKYLGSSGTSTPTH